MATPEDAGVVPNLWPSISWSTDPKVNQELRQRIALQMMLTGAKRAYPKNIGEGLSAVGDALGEMGLARRLEESDIAANKKAGSDIENRPTKPRDETTSDATPPISPDNTKIADASDTSATPVAVMPAPTQSAVVPPPVTPPPQATALGAPSTLGPSPAAVAQANSLVNPQRNRMASLLTARAVPQPNPTQEGAVLPPTADGGGPAPDQRLALAAPQGSVTTDIQPAPIVPTQLRQPTPQRPQVVAQAGNAVPGPEWNDPEPVKPAPTPWSEDEKAIRKMIQENIGNPYYALKSADILKNYEQDRAQQDKINDQQYQQRWEAWRQRFERKGSQSKSEVEANAAELSNRTGLSPEAAQAKFDAMKTAQQKDAFALQQFRLADEAMRNGIVSGAGAQMKVNFERLKAWMLANKAAGTLASNSETFLAAMKSAIPYALNNIQPTDPRVSNADAMLAQGMVGGDLSLQAETQRRLINLGMQNLHKRINQYEDQIDRYLPAKMKPMYEVPTDPIHRNPDRVKRWTDQLLQLRDDPQARAAFDAEYGPGSAALEIARADRRRKLQ